MAMSAETQELVDTNNNRLEFLRLRCQMGQATEAERQELREAVQLVCHGGDLPVAFPVDGAFEGYAYWASHFNRQAITTDPSPAEQQAPTRRIDPATRDQIICARPGVGEPPIAGRENLDNSHVPTLDERPKRRGNLRRFGRS